MFDYSSIFPMYHFLTSILFSSEYFKGERRISVESLFLSCAKVTLNWIFFFFNCYLFFSHTGSSHSSSGLSLVAASRGYSLVEGRGLLTAVAPLVVEHRLLGA